MDKLTHKQRAHRIDQRIARVDRLLQEAVRRDLDPLQLIERGIRAHDRRLSRDKALSQLPRAAGGGS